MKLRDFIIWVICIVIGVGLFITAAARLPYINQTRKDMNLVINEPLENAPPSLAFATVAMGAFRGLVVDVLWLRADQLKLAGQFFDAKQLAEWITALQPRFTAVWEFQAWNMAYNISYATPATEPEARWRWVRSGYEMLRDEAIPKNPKSLTLYRSLGYIFQHKIGSSTDETHKYYKLQLAVAMKPLLGPQTNEYFKALADAPKTFAEILKYNGISGFAADLKKADKSFENDDDFVGNYVALRMSPERFSPAAFEVINKYRLSDTLEKFDVFARAYQLRNVWKLEPELMDELNKTYGPIDWRDPNSRQPLNWENADSHAIYWAAKSLKIADPNEFSVDQLNLDRMVYHSLKNLFRYGNIIIYDVPVPPPADEATADQKKTPQMVMKTVFIRPDLRMFEPYNRANLELIEKYKELGEDVISLQDGHRNILSNAVLSFYQAGHTDYAQKILDMLKTLYPRPQFRVPLGIFVKNRLKDEMERLNAYDAEEMITLMLEEAYFRYAIHDDDEAFGREKIATEAYENYMQDVSKEEKGRIGMPEFERLRYIALDAFLQDGLYPVQLRMSLLNRIQIERPKLFEQLDRQRKKLLDESQKTGK